MVGRQQRQEGVEHDERATERGNGDDTEERTERVDGWRDQQKAHRCD